jgi:hypothetical protein
MRGYAVEARRSGRAVQDGRKLIRLAIQLASMMMYNAYQCREQRGCGKNGGSNGDDSECSPIAALQTACMLGVWV